MAVHAVWQTQNQIKRFISLSWHANLDCLTTTKSQFRVCLKEPSKNIHTHTLTLTHKSSQIIIYVIMSLTMQTNQAIVFHDILQKRYKHH